MARTTFPRAEYVHTRDWLWATIEARLRLPWLPFGVRMARNAVVAGSVIAGAVAGAAATIVSMLAGGGFWSVFVTVFGIVSTWLAWTWMRFWGVVRRGDRAFRHDPANWRPQ